MKYHLPEDTYKDWRLNCTRGFVPDARQALVIDAVRKAIEEEELFHTADVYAFCVKQLAPPPEDLAKNTRSVEHGEVGMDLYYAREYLDAQKRFQARDLAAAQLMPSPGLQLGTLVLPDLKRYTGARIEAVEQDALTVLAKRGRTSCRFVLSAEDVRLCINWAFERKQRESDFDRFCLELRAPLALTLAKIANERKAEWSDTL